MPRMPKFNLIKENMLKRMDREAKKKAAMEAEKVKIKDEKDMSNVQGAKDGGRMGYRKGGGICKKGMNKKAIGRNS